MTSTIATGNKAMYPENAVTTSPPTATPMGH
ncbi:hypothetical protein SAMN04515692_12313 [Leifsonia sp. CL147]|nr:hypothetical protein SAMN04515694_12213 [Leifsonia sp. CL154]SFM04076.1 hypothetical protein SAMN04515692_12313 [Leifsonia sp. CL147]